MYEENAKNLQPRFSVRNAFNDGLIDVSDGRFATESARKRAERPNTCSEQTYDVNAAYVDRTDRTPTDQDRKYWKDKKSVVGNEVNRKPRIFQPKHMAIEVEKNNRFQVEPADPKDKKSAYPLKKIPTREDRQYWMSDRVVNAREQPISHEQLIRNGAREAELQKIGRDRRQNKSTFPNYRIVNASNVEVDEEEEADEQVTINVSRKEVESGEFTVSFPRYQKKALDTADQVKKLNIGPDERADERRKYWGGRTVVSNDTKKANPFAPKNDD